MRKLRHLLPGVAIAIVLSVVSCGKKAENDVEKAKDPLYQGVVAYEKKDFDLAVDCFTEAIRLNPDSAGAYYSRGVTYSKKGDLDKAVADCTQAIRLNPNHAETYNLRGVAYSKKGDLDKGIADFTESVRLKPNFAPAYFNRGIAYREKGDLDKAKQDFEKTKPWGPSESDVEPWILPVRRP